MKGFFTQGVALLLREPIAFDALALARHPGVRRGPGSGDWAIGGESLVVPMREGRGHFSIDVVVQPWPDDMGDPVASPNLFAAWSMGHFGPFAFPGSFARASQQAWTWPAAKAKPPEHAAFLRLRAGYCFGAQPSSPVMPDDCRPLDELREFTAFAAGIAKDVGVLAYFNPNGEVLTPPEAFAEALAFAEKAGLPPLDVWSNVRMFDLQGIADGWTLMDTVGMWQLDVPDHELFMANDRYQPQEVERFLRNVSLYVVNNGQVIKDGDTIDGPGGRRWQAKTYRRSFSDPPREVLRWFAVDGSRPPKILFREEPKAAAGGKSAAADKPWWKPW